MLPSALTSSVSSRLQAREGCYETQAGELKHGLGLWEVGIDLVTTLGFLPDQPADYWA